MNTECKLHGFCSSIHENQITIRVLIVRHKHKTGIDKWSLDYSWGWNSIFVCPWEYMRFEDTSTLMLASSTGFDTVYFYNQKCIYIISTCWSTYIKSVLFLTKKYKIWDYKYLANLSNINLHVNPYKCLIDQLKSCFNLIYDCINIIFKTVQVLWLHINTISILYECFGYE